MAKEIVGFRGHLEFFLLSDDEARWKAIGWIILVVGAAGSFDLVVLNSPVEDAVFLMAVITLIMAIAWIGWYCSFRPYQNMETSPSRRSLVLRAAASMAGLFVGVSLSRFQARALDSELLQATKTNDYGAASDVFKHATTASVRLDKTLVRNTSHRLISAADKPAAWDAALASLDYHSFLNRTTAPNEQQGTYIYFAENVVDIGAPNIPGTWNFNVPYRGDHYILVKVDAVPADRAARFQFIGSQENAAYKTGPESVIVDGKGQASISLDGCWVKHAVIRNATVLYHGGRLVLDEVYFVNCNFLLPLLPNGRRLAEKITNSPAVTIDLA